MGVFTIETATDPFYSFTSTLDGIDYAFEFRFNQRENCWYFSIGLSDGTELANGIKVLCNRNLIRKFVDDRMPPGLLMALSGTPDTTPPGLNDLGDGLRVTMYYYDKAERTSLGI